MCPFSSPSKGDPASLYALPSLFCWCFINLRVIRKEGKTRRQNQTPKPSCELRADGNPGHYCFISITRWAQPTAPGRGEWASSRVFKRSRELPLPSFPSTVCSCWLSKNGIAGLFTSVSVCWIHVLIEDWCRAFKGTNWSTQLFHCSLCLMSIHQRDFRLPWILHWERNECIQMRSWNTVLANCMDWARPMKCNHCTGPPGNDVVNCKLCMRG